MVEAWDREQKNKLATGKLITADNQIDTATGTVKMKAEFGNDDARAVSQPVRQRAHADADAERRDLVPTAAIQRGAPGTFVYVVKDDQTVTVAPVKLGPAQGEVDGRDERLAPGAMVVVDGADKLREGAKVEVITREGQARRAAASKAAARGAARRARPPTAAARRTGECGAPQGAGAEASIGSRR